MFPSRYWPVSAVLALLAGDAGAQDSAAVRFSGYAEVYYAYDFAQPGSGERPSFLYNHKRHNEVNANLLLLRAELKRDAFRGAVGLMGGTYAQYNLSSEPDMLRNVYEAQVGARLSARGDVWVDAGIFPSHIGFESAIGMDCPNLTRSLVAENTPYYEAGARLSARPSKRLEVAGLLLNGWQRIQREPGNQRPAFGTQLRYDDGAGLVLNWSTFVGSMGPDSIGERRWYSNLYAQLEGDASLIVIGFDAGVQENRGWRVNLGEYAYWMSAVGAFRQRVKGRWWVNGRAEVFLDDYWLNLPLGMDALLGASAGVDCRISEQAWWRAEYRLLRAPDGGFVDAQGAPSATNMVLTTALCLRL